MAGQARGGLPDEMADQRQVSGHQFLDGGRGGGHVEVIGCRRAGLSRPPAVVIQNGQKVASQLQYIGFGLSAEWDNAHANLVNVVAQANEAAAELAELNGQIASGTVAGRPVNELMDKRDLLVRKLGELVGGNAVPGPDNTVSVTVNGISILSGTSSQAFTLSGANDLGNAPASPPTIMWGSTPVPVESGSAAGLLAALRTDLPSLRAGVDAVATSLRDAVNIVFATGFTLAGEPGELFFDGTDATNLTVVPTVPGQLAIAKDAGLVDGSIAGAIGDLAIDERRLWSSGVPSPRRPAGAT